MFVDVKKTHSAANNTHLQGYVQASYSELLRAFGEPLAGDGYKTRVGWVIEFTGLDGDSVVATVYDWKQYDTALSNVQRWNVGGFSSRAVQVVTDYLDYMHDMELEVMAETDSSWR